MATIDDEDEFAEYAANALPRLRRIAFLLWTGIAPTT